MEFDAVMITAVAATFLLAGTVKGVIGLGLPTVCLALLTATLDLTTAMALLLVPSLATNLWQALVGGRARAAVRRTWPFLLAAGATVWLGARALTSVDLAWLSALLGGLIITYSAVSLLGLRLKVPDRHRMWAGPLLGGINGVLTGMTGSFAVPGVMYLQSLELDRDTLIQAMGMLFAVSTLALAAALHDNRLLSAGQGFISLAALAPAIAGMVIGQRIRRWLSGESFQRVFFCSLLALGGYILITALVNV